MTAVSRRAASATSATVQKATQPTTSLQSDVEGLAFCIWAVVSTTPTKGLNDARPGPVSPGAPRVNSNANTTQPTVTPTWAAAHSPTARPSRGTQVASARPRLVSAAP